MPTADRPGPGPPDGEAAFDADREWSYALVERAPASSWGRAGLHRRSGPETVEIGYWVRSDRTGRGYATAAAPVSWPRRPSSSPRASSGWRSAWTGPIGPARPFRQAGLPPARRRGAGAPHPGHTGGGSGLGAPRRPRPLGLGTAGPRPTVADVAIRTRGDLPNRAGLSDRHRQPAVSAASAGGVRLVLASGRGGGRERSRLAGHPRLSACAVVAFCRAACRRVGRPTAGRRRADPRVRADGAPSPGPDHRPAAVASGPARRESGGSRGLRSRRCKEDAMPVLTWASHHRFWALGFGAAVLLAAVVAGIWFFVLRSPGTQVDLRQALRLYRHDQRTATVDPEPASFRPRASTPTGPRGTSASASGRSAGRSPPPRR